MQNEQVSSILEGIRSGFSSPENIEWTVHSGRLSKLERNESLVTAESKDKATRAEFVCLDILHSSFSITH